MTSVKSPLIAIALLIGLTATSQAAVIAISDVFTHNEKDNYGGNPTDLYNGSGMNNYGNDGVAGWPSGEGDPSTWTATTTSYGAEWQSGDLLDAGESPTNGKIGWAIIDLGTVTSSLENLYIWNIRETRERVVTDFNVYIASTPSIAPTHGPTNSTSIDYDFSSGGWTSIATGLSGTHLGDQVVSLGNNSAQYIGIEIIANGGDGTRAGFAEFGVTAVPEPSVPEPSVALLSGLGALMLLRRRKH